MNVNEALERLPLPVKSPLPELVGATAWLDRAPLSPADLKGKVVLVNFWTYTCVNWIRTLPYLRTWADTYGPHGLVVIGVHTPEFSIEHDIDNVRRAVRSMNIEHPIAIDNRYAVWAAFANHYWPAAYVADANGRIRHHHFGEGGYARSELVIRQLLTDAGAIELPPRAESVAARGLESAADWPNVRTPETYLGLARSVGFTSRSPLLLEPDEWALEGGWTRGREAVVVNEPRGRILLRFRAARDVNLILSPPTPDASVRFRILLDGEPPRDAHGIDVDRDGDGVVDEARLYQLIRQPPPIDDRVVTIEFADLGVAAFCFTFG